MPKKREGLLSLLHALLSFLFCIPRCCLAIECISIKESSRALFLFLGRGENYVASDAGWMDDFLLRLPFMTKL